MSIRKASARTTVNAGFNAARVATTNAVTIAPATATTVAGGGTLGGVTISNVAITDSTFVNVLSGDTAIGSSGGFVRITGSGFQANAGVFFNNVRVANTFVGSTQINANIPATTAGTYNFYVFNTDGSGANFTSGLITSGFPTVNATSYSVDSTFNQLISATGDAPLSFSIQPGSSNPGNFTVNAAGYISGTGVSDGAYALTVIVDDAQNQSTQADLTVTVASSEPYFNLTTLLLPGDGTNNANNQAFTDSSTNNFTITRNGNATQGTFSPFSQTGWSNYFDGSGDYLSAAYNSAFAFPGDFTIEFWVNWSAHGSSAGFVTNMQSSGGAPAGWQIVFNGANDTVSLEVAGSYPFITSSSTLPKNTWAHVAVVRSGSATNNVKMYFDGVQVAQGTNTSTLDSTNASLFIGCERTGGAFITGYMSNVRIVKGTAVYTSAFTPPTSPLTAITNTQLLTCQSNRFIDNSTNAFTITVNGNPSVQAFSPFAPAAAYSAAAVGGSGYFDGTVDYLQTQSNASLVLGSSDFSIEWWEYRTTVGSEDTPFSTGNYSSGFVSSLFGYSGTVGLISTNGSSWNVFSSPAYIDTLTANTWNHFVYTRSGTAFRVFMNGKLSNYTTASGSVVQNNNQFNIGGDGVQGQFAFPGYIFNVRVCIGSIPTSYQTSSTTPGQTLIFTPPTAPVTTTSQGATSGDVKLLLNFTNAGITDATAKNVLETLGDAKISTAQSKFGGSSMYFDGTGDYLFARSIPDLTFGTGNFTVEGWFYASSLGGQPVLLNIGSDAAGLVITFLSSKIYAYFVGAGNVFGSGGATLATNTWYHFAWARSGSTHTFYIDGTAYGSTYSSAGNHSSAAGFTVAYPQPAGSNYFTGYIDDLRITRGFARYTANFTPPAATFRLR